MGQISQEQPGIETLQIVFIPVKNEKIKETLGPEQMVNSLEIWSVFMAFPQKTHKNYQKF